MQDITARTYIIDMLTCPLAHAHADAVADGELAVQAAVSRAVIAVRAWRMPAARLAVADALTLVGEPDVLDGHRWLCRQALDRAEAALSRGW